MKLPIILALALSLGACATVPDMTNWTPEQIAAYNAQMNYQMQMTGQFMNQATANLQNQTQGYAQGYTPYQAPAITPLGHSNGTALCQTLSTGQILCREN